MQTEPALPITETIRSVIAEDGYDLRYRVWSCPAAPTATMVLLNGVMSHSAWFQNLAEPLMALDLRVVGADRRGSGLNDRDRGDAPSRQILLSDLRRIIEHENPNGGRVYLVGWCWGGVLAINAAVEFGDLVDGIILIAPGLFPSEPIRLAMQDQDRILRSDPANVPYVTNPIRENMFTDGAYLDGFILKDNLRLRTFTPRFFKIMLRMGAIAVTQLRRVTQPILLILAARDAVVNNRRTLKAFQQIAHLSVTFGTCDCQHGMQFEAPQELATRIASWLEAPRGRTFR